MPVLEIPDRSVLRTFRPGDERRWAKLMSGAIGTWDQDSTTKLFLGRPGPDMVDTDHAERWRNVFANIGSAGGDSARVALRSVLRPIPN